MTSLGPTIVSSQEFSPANVISIFLTIFVLRMVVIFLKSYLRVESRIVPTEAETYTWKHHQYTLKIVLTEAVIELIKETVLVIVVQVMGNASQTAVWLFFVTQTFVCIGLILIGSYCLLPIEMTFMRELAMSRIHHAQAQKTVDLF